MTKVAGQFVFETEKANVHNILLKQIQGGVRLKPTKCNDRSKPILAGLRKFRRQMTIEEQIQKSESRAQMAEVVNVLTDMSFHCIRLINFPAAGRGVRGRNGRH